MDNPNEAEPKETGRELIDSPKLARDEAKVEAEFWPKLRRLAGRLPFLDELLAAYFCAIDPGSPIRVKAILMGALAYFVLPFDAIPDFLAFFGFADDAAVIYAAVKTVADHIKPTHRQKAREAVEKLRS